MSKIIVAAGIMSGAGTLSLILGVILYYALEAAWVDNSGLIALAVALVIYVPAFVIVQKVMGDNG